MPFMNPNQDPEFRRLMRRLQNARTKTKVHHETCPVCGAKLVNLYRKDVNSGEWRCRKCWEKKAEEVASEVVVDNTPACERCQVHADAQASNEPACCAWFLENVVCGDKSVKSCPHYKPVEGGN